MASLITCGACASCGIASCITNQICGCFGSVTKRSSVITRIVYTSIFLSVSVLAWVWYVWGELFYTKLPKTLAIFVDCPKSDCFGTMSVYRIMFSLFIFFLTHLLSSFCCSSRTIHSKHWGLKIFLLLASLVVSFFLPNQLFLGWAWIALIGGAMFLLLQLILLIDFTHSWSKSMLHRAEQDMFHNQWYYLLLTILFFLYGSSLAFIIVSFIGFTTGECSTNTSFILINIILIAIGAIVSTNPSVQEKNPQSGLLQAGTVTLYTSYLVWSALYSQPDDFCNNKVGDSYFSAIVGAILVFSSVCYSTLRVSQQQETLMHVEEGSQQRLIDEETKSSEQQEIETQEEQYSFTFFYICFCLATCYVNMLITNWMIVSYTEVEMEESDMYIIDKSMGSFWVKISSSWLAHLLYIWTLIAPVIFPDREYTYTF